MNKKLKIFLTCALCAAAVLACVPWAVAFIRNQREATPETYAPAPEPEYVTFGSYPQSKVTDEALLRELNALTPEWKSYGYFSGNGFIGSAKASDDMKYADVTLNGVSYRGVVCSAYRPYCCHIPPENTRQESRLALNQVYWFRRDPIRWIVLDRATGLLMSEKVLDSQAFNTLIYTDDPGGRVSMGEGIEKAVYYTDEEKTVNATDYYYSDIRAWLNGVFLPSAFNEAERERLSKVKIDNSAWNEKETKYPVKTFEDQVFLLSFKDVTEPRYGFSAMAESPDPRRAALPTDYALAQGSWAQPDPMNEGTTWWWLRSASEMPYTNCDVGFYGGVYYTYALHYFPDFTDSGVRPAICLREGA